MPLYYFLSPWRKGLLEGRFLDRWLGWRLLVKALWACSRFPEPPLPDGHVEYFAELCDGSGDTEHEPGGIVRRRQVAGRSIDEAFRRDLTWVPTSALDDVEYKGELGHDFVEIDERAAETIIARWSVRDGD